MNLFNLNATTSTPVTTCSNCRANKLAFDGVNYYYTVNCDCRIIKYNIKCKSEQSLLTERVYDSICYDTTEKCFWATTKNNYTNIFKLDCCMREIDCIFIETCGRITGSIIDVSYDCESDSIYVAYPNQVLEVFKDGNYILRCEKMDSYITCVFALPSYYYVVFYRDKKQFIHGFNSYNVLTYAEEIDCDKRISSIVFAPESLESDWYIDILYNRNNCYPYLQKSLVTACDLGFKPSDCAFDIVNDGGCISINCCDPMADFVESIALIEASIAHILNAEGEKIQYAVAQETDMDTILSVNKSVTKTIVQVTHLEQVLHGILESLSEQGICFEKC